MADIFRKDDEAGNSLIITRKGEAERELKLQLKGELRARNIGLVKDGCLYVKRNRAKHLHRKSNSYGFNAYVLENAKLFDKVILTDDYGTYNIPKSAILLFGKYLYFKNSGTGFEKQIFLNLDLIENYKQ